MAPPHTATTTTSQASGRPALRKGPVILSRVPFKVRLNPPAPHPPAFNWSDENMIKLYVRIEEEEAMKPLRLKEAKIREDFRLREEDFLEKLRQETECKTLDGVSESLARMDIDRNILKEEEEGRPHQGCAAVLLRKHNKKRADTSTQDVGIEFQSDMPPYENQSSKPNVVMKYGKENEENYPPPRRGYRKDTVIKPRLTFPPPSPTNRTKPNESAKKTSPASDTRYSLFTLEQDLATPANTGGFFFKQGPLLPLRSTAENLPRLNPNISHFNSDFPFSRRSGSTTSHNPPPQTPPNKIIGRSRSPAQQQQQEQSSFFFSPDEPDDSEKENFDELAVLRRQRQHLHLFTPPATPTASTTATSKAKPNPYISSSSAPCSPRGRKRVRDDSSDDVVVDVAITTTTSTMPLINTISIPATRRIRGLDAPFIDIPQPLTINNHDYQRQSPNADMTMELEPQVKRARRLRLLSPPESSKPFLLLRDSKGLFGPQSLVIR